MPFRLLRAFATLCFLSITSMNGSAKGSQPLGEPLRVLSLNLHGYHPMGEKERYFEYRDGRIEPAPSELFYFKLQELDSGESTRQRALVSLINEVDPDFAAFQEVGAGLPGFERNCEAFERPSSTDLLGVNTVIRLEKKLTGYRSLLACRGNVGWQTSSDIFSEKKIVTLDKYGVPQTVFDFGEIPYPEGLLVEGFAILYKKEWKVVFESMREIFVGPSKERFMYQLAAFESKSKGLVVVANLHGGHKLRHFEQAVAIRKDISEFNRELMKVRSAAAQRSQGSVGNLHFDHPQVIILGDMNESLARDKKVGEVKWYSVPWEMSRPGLFDLSQRVESMSNLKGGTLPADLGDQLISSNFDTSYKPWAQVSGPEERVRFAFDALADFLAITPDSEIVMKEAVHDFLKDENDRIDLIFVSESSRVEGAGVMGAEDWRSLNAVSDHPLIWAAVRTHDARQEK